MKKIIFYFVGLLMLLVILNSIARSCNDTANVIHKEFGASALLKKYEYFKDLSAAIDKKRADIEMYQSEISGMTAIDKDDKFYIQQRKSELLGIISMHNSLCSEYNSAMSKFNYRFTNAGDLPETNLTPLPREYKPYINNLKSN
jgi:hypothetical protein